MEGQTGTSRRSYVCSHGPNRGSTSPYPIAVNPRSRLGDHLPMDWIREALDVTQTASIRRRKFPAELTVQAIIAMALYPDRSMLAVVQSLDLVLPDDKGDFVVKSAITQARQRIGSAPLEVLFRKSAKCWGSETPSNQKWKGLTLWTMDGTTLKTPDTPINRNQFGAQRYSSGKVASYPQVRAVTLTALATRMIIDASFGEYNKNEMKYAEDLSVRISDNSITIFDKGFYSASILLPLTSNGKQRHFLIPAKAKHRGLKISGSDTDAIVESPVSPQARKKNPDLPSTWTMRKICSTDSQGNAITLLTSILDKKKFPASELFALYRRRWEIETSFSEVKVSMFKPRLTLRSMAPDTINQEIWAFFIAYNLVRLEASKAAKILNARPVDISFQDSLVLYRDELITKTRHKSKQSLDLLERRRRRLGRHTRKPSAGRKCPRVVKAHPHRYPEIWVYEKRGSPKSKRSA